MVCDFADGVLRSVIDSTKGLIMTKFSQMEEYIVNQAVQT